MGLGTANALTKLLVKQKTLRVVEAAPSAMQAALAPSSGAEIGVRRPADVAEQARREADAAVGRRFIGKERRNPVGDRAAVRRETRKAATLEFGGDDQRILRARLGIERLIEQSFAKAR